MGRQAGGAKSFSRSLSSVELKETVGLDCGSQTVDPVGTRRLVWRVGTTIVGVPTKTSEGPEWVGLADFIDQSCKRFRIASLHVPYRCFMGSIF